MDPVRLNSKKPGISVQQNGYFILCGGNREDILLLHDITDIDRIHPRNQLHVSGRRHVQLSAAEGTGGQLADPFSVHINVKGSEQFLFLPLLGIDPDLPLQLQRDGKYFRLSTRQRPKKENAE